MNLIVAMFFVEIAIVLLFLPIKIGVKGYFSLSMFGAGVDFLLFGIVIVRLRLIDAKGTIALRINDKDVRLASIGQKFAVRKIGTRALKNLLESVKSGEIMIKGDVLAVLGDFDPKNCALMIGAINALINITGVKGRIYSDFDTQRADADFFFDSKINLIQALTAIM